MFHSQLDSKFRRHLAFLEHFIHDKSLPVLRAHMEQSTNELIKSVSIIFELTDDSLNLFLHESRCAILVRLMQAIAFRYYNNQDAQMDCEAPNLLFLENFLLSLLKKMSESNLETVSSMNIDPHYLSTVSIFLASDQISAKVCALEILSNACVDGDTTTTVLAVLKALGQMTHQSNCFWFLGNSALECNDSIYLAAWNLVVAIARQVDAEVCIQIYTYITQLDLFQNAKKLKIELWSIVAPKFLEFQMIYLESIKALLSSWPSSSKNNQIYQKACQLQEAFCKLENDRNNLLSIEHSLQDKCNLLSNNLDWLQIVCQESYPKVATTNDVFGWMINQINFGVDDFNVKSSEEEVVNVPVCLFSKSLQEKQCREDSFMHISNDQDNFKTNEYFSCIMSNHISGNSSSKTHENVSKISSLNQDHLKVYQSNRRKLSDQPYRSFWPVISRSGIANKYLEANDFTNSSDQSHSPISSVFSSNFILLKSNKIYSFDD